MGTNRRWVLDPDLAPVHHVAASPSQDELQHDTPIHYVPVMTASWLG